MIEYISYESVNGVPFGATENEIIELLGKPDSKDVHKNKRVSLYYQNFTLHLDNKNCFRLIDIVPTAKVTINGQAVGWTLKKVSNIIRMDSYPVVDDAYITLRDLGVTFVNFHNIKDDDMSERVITFFAKGEMEIYDSEQSFKLNDQVDNPNNSLHIIDKSEIDIKKEVPSTPQNNNTIPDDFMR